MSQNIKFESARGKTKNGIITTKLANGITLSEITYVNDQKHGTSKLWWHNGQLGTKTNYVNGLRDGLEVGWNTRGYLTSRKNYIKGQLHGLWIYYDLNDKSVIKENYIDGKLHGIQETWFEDSSNVDSTNTDPSNVESSNSGASQQNGKLKSKEMYIYGNKTSDKEYQKYWINNQIVLNQIIQIKDLADLTLKFL